MQKGLEKLEKIPAWNLAKVRNKSEVIDEARKKGITGQSTSLMDIFQLKNAELEHETPEIKVELYFRGNIVKDDSDSYAVFTEQGIISITNDSSKSHGYHFKVNWMRKTNS